MVISHRCFWRTLAVAVAAVASDDDSGRSIPHSLRLHIWRVKAHPSLTAPWYCHDTLVWSGVTMSRNSGRCHASHLSLLSLVSVIHCFGFGEITKLPMTTYWQLALLYAPTHPAPAKLLSIMWWAEIQPRIHQYKYGWLLITLGWWHNRCMISSQM